MKNFAFKALTLGIVVLTMSFFKNIHSRQIGSDTVVTVQPQAIFPAADNDNKMMGFGWFKNGFVLEDATTSCTFDSVFPVSGAVALKGGTLYLNTDLHLSNITTLTAMGKFCGQNHIITLDSSVERLINTHYPTTLQDLDLFINSDLTISTTIKVEGTCYITGRNKRMYLDPNTQIIVGHNATLSLKNLEIEGVDGYSIKCLDDTGKIILDNVSLYMDGSYNFSRGQLEIWNNVDFAGSYTFYYDCLQTITVANDSVLRICDGAIFAVGTEKALNRDRIIYFEDPSSKLWIDNADVTIGGAGGRLTRGSLVLSGRVNFDILSTNTSNGLLLGDGTPEGDTVAEFYPATYVTFKNGHVVYNESDPYKFVSKSTYSRLIRGATNTFHIMKDQVFGSVTITVDPNSPLTVEPGTKVGYEDCTISMPSVKFCMTGSRYNTYTTLLDGNDSIFLQDGILPFYLLVQNSNNIISGSGNLGGITTLYNNNAAITFNMDGHILNNIVSYGGTINLAKNLNFAYDKFIMGSGIVNLSNNNLSLGTKDVTWTSSIYWVGNNGNLELNSKVSLSSTWTFSGNCTIMGNSNILDLGTRGNIYVERGSTLKLKNITVQGLSGTCLQCTDNNGKIILDDAYMVQDNDYTFSIGGLEIIGDADFSGTYTFFYDSTNTLSIKHNTYLIFSNGITMAIGTQRPLNKDKITYFEDTSATALFKNSNLKIGRNGARFTKGTLYFSGYVNVDAASTSTTNGIIVGDGTPENDSLTKFDSASLIRFRTGHLTYNLCDPNKFVSLSQYSKIIRDATHTFHAAKDIIFSNITLKIDPAAPLTTDPGKLVSYSDCKFVFPTVKFSISGARYNAYTSLLDGNGDELFLEDGNFPIYLLIKDTGNTIRGSGDISGQISFYDNTATTYFSLAGQIQNRINLNGAKIILSKDLEMGITGAIIGTGTVNLTGYDFVLGSRDISWTSSIYWDGYGGKINLNSMLALSSSWTFSGNCTIIGNNNVLVMKPTGRIYVEKGSTLTFKNLKIYGMQGTNISCIDDTGKIVFSEVLTKMTDDYHFQKGSFDVDYLFDIKATDKTFYYESKKQSNIRNCAVLTLYSTTGFCYAPVSASKNLINLQTVDSVIWLKEASLHSTATGMQLTKGRIFVEGKCTISSDATCKAEAITLGDGISASKDLIVKILPGATFDLTSGYVVSKNIIN